MTSAAVLPPNGSSGTSLGDVSARVSQACAGLPEALRPPFQRLGRELLAQAGGATWRLFIGQYEHTREREQVARAIEALLPGSTRVVADLTRHPDWSVLESELALIATSTQNGVVQVFGLEGWLDPLDRDNTAKKLRAANLRREAFARSVPVALVFWLREAQVRDWVTHAPDLWSWRSAVHEFIDGEAATASRIELPRPYSEVHEIDNRPAEERRSRVEELQTYLESTAGQPDSQLRIDLYDELADLLHSLGEVDTALTLRQGALTALCERLVNEREMAVNRGKIADILQDRGQLDEALRIRQEELLPVFERLGDVRSATITKGYIADILQARGQFDEALSIFQEDQLPVFERLGDVRSAAVTKGRIADILLARGQLDDALRIRQEELLPVFERLGDVRLATITRGYIADILQARGQLDEALRIRQEEELPVYERLGDVREAAVTKGQIADILQARGQLDQALRIRQEEELPVYKRLGDVRLGAVTKGKIADILQARGQLDEALRIRQEEELPVYERLGDVRLAAVTKGKIADILQERGQLDEALRIRQEEELPVYERLGDVRSTAATRVKIADVLRDRGQLDEALRILQEALPMFERLGDVRGISSTQFKIASARLSRGEHQTREGFESIFKSLAAAWKSVQQLQAPDGIAAVGSLLAQVLAMAKAFGEARGVLDQVDQAQALLGDEAGRQHTAALRSHIEGMAAPAG